AMLKSMAKNPIVFAMANPDPEISYELALKTRKGSVMATGRAEYPRHVHTGLGFPYIFRGALHARGTRRNEAMRLAAVRAIAGLAKRSVPEAVNLAYNQQNITCGKEYIIPKPVDYRLITHVAPAVAKAAMETGVARDKIKDWDQYRAALRKRLGLDDSMMRAVSEKARSNPKRVVFAEADTYKILKAAQIVIEEGLARPILLGNRKKIRKLVEENALEIYDSPVIDPAEIPEDKV